MSTSSRTFSSGIPWQPSRRNLLQLSGLGALGLTLAACSGPSVTEDTARAKTTATTDWSTITPASEITWWSNHPGASKAIEEELIARFAKVHPEITIKHVTAGANYDEVAQRFQAASSTSNLPDLVISSDVWWFRYFLNSQIMPLDDVFKHLEVDTSDFNATLYSDYEFDSQHWAAPYARSTPLFYYNRDLWAKAGLPDRGPATWAELEEWAPKLAALLPADGAPLGLDTGTSWAGWWMENVIWGQGGAYSKDWTVTLDTPEAEAAGDFIRALFNDSKVAGLGTDTSADFAAGIFGSMVGSTGSLKGLLEAATFNLGTSFLPDGPKGSGVPTGGTGLAIPASRTPEQQLAAAMFLAFITDADNTAYFSQNTGYMPVRTSAQEGAIMTEVYATTPQFRTAIDQLETKTRTQDWVRVFVPGGDQIITEGIEQMVLKNVPAATAWASITPRLQKAFQENVEPYL